MTVVELLEGRVAGFDALNEDIDEQLKHYHETADKLIDRKRSNENEIRETKKAIEILKKQ